MAVTHIGEIVEKLRGSKTPEDKIEILKSVRNVQPFRKFLKCLFDPAIRFHQVQGGWPKIASYSKSVIPYGRGISLYSKICHIDIFFEGKVTPKVNRLQDQYTRFVENLPGIEPELFTRLLNNDQIKGLEMDIIKEVFGDDPDFFFLAFTKDFEAPKEDTSENNSTLNETQPQHSQKEPVQTKPPEPTVPVKRGRGRPRKQPVEQ